MYKFVRLNRWENWKAGVQEDGSYVQIALNALDGTAYVTVFSKRDDETLGGMYIFPDNNIQGVTLYPWWSKYSKKSDHEREWDPFRLHIMDRQMWAATIKKRDAEQTP